jgi:hypothetical protein
MTAERDSGASPEGRSSDYEPPRVERVLGPDELEREVVYAGTDLHTTVQ